MEYLITPHFSKETIFFFISFCALNQADFI